MGEPNGSEPPPRSVCQNATLNRSLSAALQIVTLCSLAEFTLCFVKQMNNLPTFSMFQRPQVGKKASGEVVAIGAAHQSFIGLPMMTSSAL